MTGPVARLVPRVVFTAAAVAAAATGVGSVACARASAPARQPRQPREPVAALERAWGRLATVANLPTGPQAGTGDRVGLFDGGAGTVWGLPLAVGREDGADDGTGDEGGPRDGRDSTLSGCAPAALRGARVTDTLPARLGAIVGAMNAPTGYRGGTGRLEVVLRDAGGALHWARVRSDTLPGAPICGGYPPLRYYRLARGAP